LGDPQAMAADLEPLSSFVMCHVHFGPLSFLLVFTSLVGNSFYPMWCIHMVSTIFFPALGGIVILAFAVGAKLWLVFPGAFLFH